MSTRETDPHYCSGEGCDNHFRSHIWGNMKAQRDGWFIQKNGQAWCPEHTPEWVAEWQARKQKGE